MTSASEAELLDALTKQEALARQLFEQQFVRLGGRKRADPTWGDLDEPERDEYRQRALDAGPLLDELRAQADELRERLDELTTMSTGPYRLGRSHDDIIYETIPGAPHKKHPRVCVAFSPAYARQIRFALNAVYVGTASHGTLVGAAQQIIERAGDCADPAAVARQIVDLLRPDLNPGGAS